VTSRRRRQPDKRSPAAAPVAAVASGSPGLREQHKAATRHKIQGHALRLFLAKGYESTTVAEIATAAGVSHMTFFRYFRSKEAVVEDDEYDPVLVEMIRNRPDHEDPLTALRNAIGEGLAVVYPTERDALLVRTQLILRTPALRARMVDNLKGTESLLAEAMASRLQTEVSMPIRVLAAASLATLTTAITTWADSDGASELPDLIDAAFEALTGLVESSPSRTKARARAGRGGGGARR
jgi:AcrR family transcriptional regulator